MGVFQLALFKFGEADEADRVGLLVGQDQGQGRKLLGIAAKGVRCVDGVGVVSLLRLNVVLMQVFYLYVLFRFQVLLPGRFFALFAKRRKQGVEDGGDEENREQGAAGVKQ